MSKRLETLKRYLQEAELDKESNKLYIEDLMLSIAYEESKPASYQVNKTNEHSF